MKTMKTMKTMRNRISGASKTLSPVFRAPFRRVLLIITLPVLLSSHLFAETWTFTAREVTSVQRDEMTRTVLEGDVKVNSENLEITAGHIELMGPDYDILKGEGSILVKELEKNITIEARKLDYDKSKKLIKFRGLVTLIDVEDETVIRCEALDYYEDEELVFLQAAVRLIKDKTVGRGEFATYHRKLKKLELLGRPIVWQNNDKYQADRITVNLDTNEISMEGKVQGTLTTEDTEEKKEGEEPADDTDIEIIDYGELK